jgi:hypothetical protein
MDSGSPPLAPRAGAENTLSLRQRLLDETKKATGYDLFDWQLEIAEALVNQRDTLCIAGTGSGKTLAFVMPCLIDPRALVWVVSPLNYIEKQQEKAFNDWGIQACSVNASTSYPGIHKVHISHTKIVLLEFCFMPTITGHIEWKIPGCYHFARAPTRAQQASPNHNSIRGSKLEQYCCS